MAGKEALTLVPARRMLRGALGVAGALGVMEVAGRAGLFDPQLLPLPSTVLARTGGLVVNEEFLADFGATLTAWLEGLFIAVALAVPLGLVVGTLSWAGAALQPIMEFLRPIPSVILIPLAVLVLQNDVRSKVAITAYASIWPVLINTIYGLREADPLAKETLHSFGFGRLAVLRRVSLPSAAPFIATGIRLAASTGFVVAIGAELIGGGVNGIGIFLIHAGSGGGQTALMLATVVWAGAFGLVTNALLVRAERRAFPWHHALAGERT